MSADRIKARDLAKGKWRSILPHLGVPEHVLDGRHHRCPANGQGEDRFRFADREGSGNYFCHCSRGEKGGINLLMCCKGLDYPSACREIERIAGDALPAATAPTNDGKQRMARITTVMEAIEPDDEVAKYLRGRGLAVPPSGLARARLDYYDKGKRERLGPFASMVAVIRGSDGSPQSLHVTYLQGGKKAPVRSPRKIIRGGYQPGSAIRLFPIAEHLGVAEGIETALAAAKLFDLPTWALVNEGNMRRFQPPVGVKQVSVFADKDDNYAGQAAAYGLANELERAGIHCDVFVPPQSGKCDWNDVLLAQQVAA
ncbi:toprim domain-containing protein [Xanthomonas oryzae]|uniref:toprim domain-containing protein n=1 Tax=Xanthomonas oryzae TaxID=347 RepID=UPI0002FA0B20|nr:toprim domain-containing protein [Xanthomonas oryzae]